MSAPCMGCGTFFSGPVPWSNSIPHKQSFFWGCTAPRGDIENEPSRIAGRMTGLLRHLAKLCIRTTGVLSSAFLRRFERLSRRFSSASLHRNKKNARWAIFLFLGRMTGFEPATFGTTNQRSNQLSYIRQTKSVVVELIGLEPTTPCMPCKCSTN